MSPRQELAQMVRKALLDVMERRPISEHPGDSTRTIVDDGKVRAQAFFRNGQWVRPGGKALNFVPSHYLRFKR